MPSASFVAFAGLASGALAALAALGLALHDHLGWAVVAVAVAAAAWRPHLDRFQRPLQRPWVAGLLLLVMLSGAWFRTYRATEIPAGMITVDEPRLYINASEILDGKRESYNVRAGEGQLTFALQALSMKVFGRDLAGYRMASVLCGIAMIGLMALLGRELDGTRLGLAAAAFTALAVWPVSFSRAEYLMAATYLPILACFWLFLLGLRRGSPLIQVLAGFSFGLCFSVYQSGKLLLLLLPFLAALLWLHRRDMRVPLREAWLPLLSGALISLAPLFLWAVRDPNVAFHTYFSPLFAGFTAGGNVAQMDGVLPKLNAVVGRILPELPEVASMFTTHGPMRCWYFVAGQPVVDTATLFFFLCGTAVCLVRFRRPTYALLLVWWFVGLTPTLVSNPALHMDERRIMLSLPPTLLIAAAGFLTGLQLLTLGLRRTTSERMALVASLSFFTYYGVCNWHTYFDVINHDPRFLANNHANFDNGTRAFFREQAKGPIYAISTRNCVDEAWQAPGVQNELQEHFAVLGPIPHRIAALDGSYFAEQGLFGLLRKQPKAEKGEPAPDPVILLTPFHFYLEPFLVKELGGKRVADVPLEQTPSGPDYTDVGMALDPKTACRLVRLHGFSPAKLTDLEARWLLPFRLEELTPPRALGTREEARKTFVHDPAGIKLMEDYAKAPGRWKTGNKFDFKMPEPWWWVATWFLPHVKAPYRLNASWGLQIPADGSYRFAVSATPFTVVKVDGKAVASYMPRTRESYAQAREGVWGEPVTLKAGMHRFDIDAMLPSDSGYFSHVLRVLWQKPGGEKETLPMEQLYPHP